MRSSTARLKKRAAALSGFLTTKKRGDDTIHVLIDGAPKWARDVCREAHGDMLPDDHRYAMISEIAEAMGDADDPDDFSSLNVEAPIYTHALTTWLGSRADRQGYCDDAREEGLVSDDSSLTDRIAIGWLQEARETHDLLMGALQDADDADGGDDDE